MGSLFYSLYPALWKLGIPFLKRRPRLADGWNERVFDVLPSPADVWLQAASGGEAYLAASLIESAAEQIPDGVSLRVLAVTWTRQGFEVLGRLACSMRGRCPSISVDVHFAPLDTPGIVARALDAAAPKLIILLETELWPGLLKGAWERSVPVWIMNGRISGSAMRGYSLLAPALRRYAPEKVFAVTRAEAGRFEAVFPKSSVSVLPNMKFDRAGSPSPDTEPLEGLFPEGSPVRLFASTRGKEESRIVPVICSLFQEERSGITVVAPRHLSRAGSLFSRFTDLGMRPLRASDLLDGSGAAKTTLRPGSLVVWDRFGDLQKLYMLADSVFVGGSFAKCGGQNFLESLACGAPTCTGPHLDNFLWALGADTPPSLEETGLLTICRDPRGMRSFMKNAVPLPGGDRAAKRAAVLKWLDERSGSAAFLARAMLDRLLRGK